MSRHPPTYSHSIDPLDVDDWLKTITKKLERAQCTDREMVLYASGRLEGLAFDWWVAYTAAQPAPKHYYLIAVQGSFSCTSFP
jgi:hypothetical protein